MKRVEVETERVVREVENAFVLNEYEATVIRVFLSLACHWHQLPDDLRRILVEFNDEVYGVYDKHVPGELLRAVESAIKMKWSVNIHA